MIPTKSQGGAPGVLVRCAAVAAGFLTVTSAHGADGRRPVHAPAVFPFSITAAGSYYLTESIVVPSGSTGISIAASDVTLDLNGHAITSTGTANYLVNALNVTNIRITGGQLRGGGTGIRFERSAVGSTPYRFRVDQMLLTGQALYGMDIQSSNIAYPIAGIIEHNIVTAAGNTGIILTRSALGRVVANAVDAGQNGIFLVSCKNLLLQGNTCSGGASAGIELLLSDACSVVDNNTSENNWGIYLDGSNHTRVAGNTAVFNSAAGIYATGLGNHLQDNAANRNTGVGIRLDAFDEGSVQRNAVGNNTGYGIHMTSCDYNSLDWNIASGSGSTCPILLHDSSYNTVTYNRTARSTSCTGTNGIAESGTSTGNTIAFVGNLP